MDVLGNALTLYDLGLRVAAFINDLRHAQDDFLSLRAEANCLQVSLNSLCAESCQDTIYLYISTKQRSDLELILENTLLNMQDLNGFLGGCKYLVANEAKKMAKERGMRDKWKAFLKKSWATYKFAMTDPQPFRDKLVIPTQSIQIFLQSMTHVGLANVGNLLALSGHLPEAGTQGVITPVPSGGPALSGGIGHWDVIGSKIAFRKSRHIGGIVLTADLEEQVIKYILHLHKGGKPFDTKIEKDSTEKRPHSKSRTLTNVSRGKTSDTFIVRRKSTTISGSTAKRDASWSATDQMPLRLEIPPSPRLGTRSPISPSSPRIVDAKPYFDVSSDEDSRSPSPPPAPRRPSGSGPPPAPPISIRKESVPILNVPEPPRARRESASKAKEAEAKWKEDPQKPQAEKRARMSSYQPRHARYVMSETADIKSSRQFCRKKVEEEIQQEQAEASKKLHDASLHSKARRRTYSRLSRPHPADDAEHEVKMKINIGYDQAEAAMTPQGPDPESSDDENEDVIAMLEEQYGLSVSRVPFERPTIDNGTVAPVLPASLVEPDEAEDDEPAAVTILPKKGARLTSETSFYDTGYEGMSRKRSRYSRPTMYDSGIYRDRDYPIMLNRDDYISSSRSRPYPPPPPPPRSRLRTRYEPEIHDESYGPRYQARYDSDSMEDEYAHPRGERLVHKHSHNHPRSSAPDVIIYNHDGERQPRTEDSIEIHDMHRERPAMYDDSIENRDRPRAEMRHVRAEDTNSFELRAAPKERQVKPEDNLEIRERPNAQERHRRSASYSGQPQELRLEDTGEYGLTRRRSQGASPGALERRKKSSMRPGEDND